MFSYFFDTSAYAKLYHQEAGSQFLPSAHPSGYLSRTRPAIHELHYLSARRLLVRYGASMALRTLDALQLAVALEMQQAGKLTVMGASDRRLCRGAEACCCSTVDPCDPALAVP